MKLKFLLLTFSTLSIFGCTAYVTPHDAVTIEVRRPTIEVRHDHHQHYDHASDHHHRHAVTHRHRHRHRDHRGARRHHHHHRHHRR